MEFGSSNLPHPLETFIMSVSFYLHTRKEKEVAALATTTNQKKRSIVKKKQTPVAVNASPLTPRYVQSVLEAQQDLVKYISGLDSGAKIKLLTSVGVGSQLFTCYRCGELKKKQDFYVSTDLTIQTHITPICKQCAMEIAMPLDPKTKEPTNPTKETCKEMLYYMNRVWLDKLWDSSLLEASAVITGKTKNNVATALVKNTILSQYATSTWRDGDLYNTSNILELSNRGTTEGQSTDILNDFEKNKNDTIRLLGYEPFAKEALEDQPFLYAQLVGYLDMSGDANDDMMRVSSVMTIVRGFLQIARYDDLIARYMSDIPNLQKNMPTIKTLQTMKKEVTDTVNRLAESSCISLKHTKNSVKGENTWTGKMKKIKDMNLREGEVNGFDLATCKAMYQIMNMSDAAILRQIRLDDSDYADIVAKQRVLVRELTYERDNYREIARILLRENLDLKDVMNENGLLDSMTLVDLDELYACFTNKDAIDETQIAIDEVNAEMDVHPIVPTDPNALAHSDDGATIEDGDVSG